MQHAGNWSEYGAFGKPKAVNISAMRRVLFRGLQEKNMHRSGQSVRKHAKARKSKRSLQARRAKATSSFVRHKFLWIAVVLAVSVLGLIFHMMPGFGFQRPSQNAHPRQHAHVGDAGPPYVGTATLKVPPAWLAERNHFYNLRS